MFYFQACSSLSSDCSFSTEGSVKPSVKNACNTGANRFVQLAVPFVPTRLTIFADRFPAEYSADERNRKAFDLVPGLSKRT